MLETEAAIGAGFVAIVTAIGGLLWKLVIMAGNFARLELKVNTVWDFMMRRALAYGLDNGALQMNSPVSATTSMENLLEPLADELSEFYLKEGKNLNDRDLFIAVENKFGNRLMKDICIPYKMHQGSCTLAAINIAKKKAVK